MNSILLKNLTILSPYGEHEYLENGNILIEDETIKSVSITAPQLDGSIESLDMGGKIVLPGMINAHTHLYSTLALGMPAPKKQPTNFVEILEEIWWKLDLGLDADATQASFESGLLDCLEQGCTTIIDHHASPRFVAGSLDLLAKTADMIGLNISVCFECSDRNGEDNFRSELTENVDALQRYNDHPYVAPLLGLHASFTLSDTSLQSVADALAENPGWGIHIHVAEDLADQKDAQDRGYASVIQRLDHFGLLNSQAHIIHGIHMTEEDIQTLQSRGCTLVHNPTSNAGNQVGILSSSVIQSMQAGLGTDGKQNNMLAEVKEGDLVRSASGEPNIDYLELLFKNNPGIANKLFGRDLGVIRSGAKADLLFYDYDPRTEIHSGNTLRHILYGLGRPNSVMTRGKFRIEHDTIMNIDASEIRRNARKQSLRLWDEMQKL